MDFNEAGSARDRRTVLTETNTKLEIDVREAGSVIDVRASL